MNKKIVNILLTSFLYITTYSMQENDDFRVIYHTNENQSQDLTEIAQILLNLEAQTNLTQDATLADPQQNIETESEPETFEFVDNQENTNIQDEKKSEQITASTKKMETEVQEEQWILLPETQDTEEQTEETKTTTLEKNKKRKRTNSRQHAIKCQYCETQCNTYSEYAKHICSKYPWEKK